MNGEYEFESVLNVFKTWFKYDKQVEMFLVYASFSFKNINNNPTSSATTKNVLVLTIIITTQLTFPLRPSSECTDMNTLEQDALNFPYAQYFC